MPKKPKLSKFLACLRRGDIIELSGWDWNTNSKFLDEDEAADMNEAVGPTIYMLGYYLNHTERNIRCASVRVKFGGLYPEVKYIHELRLASIDKILVLQTRRRWDRA